MTKLITPCAGGKNNGKLEAIWDYENNTLIIRNLHLRRDTKYHLHDDGSYDAEVIPLAS